MENSESLTTAEPGREGLMTILHRDKKGGLPGQTL